MHERSEARRKNTRAIDPIPHLIFWSGAEGRFEAYICDLSPGGCYLNTSGKAVTGENITVELPDPGTDGAAVRISGKAVEQGRGLAGFGVQFGAMTADQLAAVDRTLASSNEQPDDRK